VLLDIGSVLGGIGLAVIGFVVVILVCVVILRLLAAFLPSYENRSAPGGVVLAHDDPDEGAESRIDGAEQPPRPAADQPSDDAPTVSSGDREPRD
jgi:hypothetical protein